MNLKFSTDYPLKVSYSSKSINLKYRIFFIKIVFLFPKNYISLYKISPALLPFGKKKYLWMEPSKSPKNLYKICT